MRRKLEVTTVAFGLLLVAAMLAGAGVTALFTDRATASQVITVGELRVQVSSDTPGATVDGRNLVCPPITITSSAPAWDTVGCHVQIASVGEIEPGQMTLTVSATTDGADLSRFLFMNNWGGGDWDPPENGQGSTPSLDSVSGTVLGTTTALEADTWIFVGWTELQPTDMGRTVTVTLTVDAVE
jgi:predicted ribosomally synthesized peptide with SipW-like signal peptide